MGEKQLLELILSELREVKATQDKHSEQLSAINSRLENHTEKLDSITEQLVKVSELEPVVQKLVNDVARIETELIVIKKAIAN